MPPLHLSSFTAPEPSSYLKRLRIVTARSPAPLTHQYPKVPEYILLSESSRVWRISILSFFGAPAMLPRTYSRVNRRSGESGKGLTWWKAIAEKIPP